MKDIFWFRNRVGGQIVRNGKTIDLKTQKEAEYQYSLQPHFTFEDAPNVCIACEG